VSGVWGGGQLLPREHRGRRPTCPLVVSGLSDRSDHLPTETDVTPAVEAMVNSQDPMTPTAPLDEFLAALAEDDNLWWRVACGHHQNLFDAACERAGLI
jgi:hypothetical protein